MSPLIWINTVCSLFFELLWYSKDKLFLKIFRCKFCCLLFSHFKGWNFFLTGFLSALPVLVSTSRTSSFTASWSLGSAPASMATRTMAIPWPATGWMSSSFPATWPSFPTYTNYTMQREYLGTKILHATDSKSHEALTFLETVWWVMGQQNWYYKLGTVTI